MAQAIPQDALTIALSLESKEITTISEILQAEVASISYHVRSQIHQAFGGEQRLVFEKVCAHVDQRVREGILNVLPQHRTPPQQPKHWSEFLVYLALVPPLIVILWLCFFRPRRREDMDNSQQGDPSTEPPASRQSNDTENNVRRTKQTTPVTPQHPVGLPRLTPPAPIDLRHYNALSCQSNDTENIGRRTRRTISLTPQHSFGLPRLTPPTPTEPRRHNSLSRQSNDTENILRRTRQTTPVTPRHPSGLLRLTPPSPINLRHYNPLA
ncbi:MAG: hypothetical protein LQ337_007158 [Flavoplaca oasis]|nr:MAG: hypothetical protein LQ337_007158 [Flavoplaca oasis]